MPRRLAAATALLATLAAASGGALAAESCDASTAAALVQAATQDRSSFDFVSSLTTGIGQRLAGTPAAIRARDWALNELARAGLENVHAEAFPMTAWLRGTETAEILQMTHQSLAVTALGGSVATPPDGITAEIALFHTYADFLAAPEAALKGKIAVVTQRMIRAEDGGGYRAANPIRRRGPSEAAKRGAVAYLLRSLGTDNHRLPHTGALNYDDKAPRIPAAALSNPDADQLERLAALGAPVRLKLVLTPTERPDAEGWNVVGEVRGRDKPDELIVIGAHLDSWDLGTGATDDGAGDAIVATVGRLLAALPEHPRRTVRVVLFGAEEMNYSGPAYAASHKDEAPRIALAAEADFGARKVYAVQLPAGVMKSPFAATLSDVLVPAGAILDIRPAMFGGDDVAGLQALGAPVASLRQNGLDYFDTHHTADDTLDKIDPAELAQAAAAWTAFVYLAADCDVDFRAPAPAGKGAE